MAIVPNRDGAGVIANGWPSNVDRPFAAPNRSGTGVPTVPAQYASEIMLDTATGLTYRAMAAGGTQWVNTDVG